jgi:hypothetical protein
MFHLEMRQGMHVVRAFNMTEEQLFARFLGPLLADQEFTYEGHEWKPRKTRVRIFDGPELQTYQLGMGRGWQEVERSYSDVTEAVLTAARRRGPAQPAVPTQPAVAVDLLRERLIGRLFAEPVSFDDLVAMAAELMPDAAAQAQLAAAQRAALEVLQAGGANLAR